MTARPDLDGQPVFQLGYLSVMFIVALIGEDFTKSPVLTGTSPGTACHRQLQLPSRNAQLEPTGEKQKFAQRT
jgi:hypothetical protein